jgi:hypothetical protein
VAQEPDADDDPEARATALTLAEFDGATVVEVD